ncbi:hypothetical protein [Arthrobacter sp. UYCo732]|uniref:hypothetical protein n=1 Tax=Arthrobacter sp. UYCo732 TaxID=3156336 RepID=UPI00339B2226
MRRFDASVTTRIDAGESGVQQSHVDAANECNKVLAAMFESDVCLMVSSNGYSAFGTVHGTIDRKNAPCLAELKFRDPEAATVLAADLVRRAREAGLEAVASAESKSARRTS